MGEAAPHFVFQIVAAHDCDALMRVLGPFALVAATLRSAQLTRGEDHVSIRIETEGLDARRAQTILHRLENMPLVRGVGFGWLGAGVSEAPSP